MLLFNNKHIIHANKKLIKKKSNADNLTTQDSNELIYTKSIDRFTQLKIIIKIHKKHSEIRKSVRVELAEMCDRFVYTIPTTFIFSIKKAF